MTPEEIERKLEEMVRQCKYEGYLRSKKWAIKRKLKLLSVDFRCEKCGYSGIDETIMEKTLDVHHLTYDRLGDENLEDLQVLCRDCHERTHGRVFPKALA